MMQWEKVFGLILGMVSIGLIVWSVRGMVLGVRRYDKYGTRIMPGNIVEIYMAHHGWNGIDKLMVVPGTMFEKTGLWLVGVRCEHPQCVNKGETYYARDELTPEAAAACTVVGILETVMQDSKVAVIASRIREDWDAHGGAYAKIDYTGEAIRIEPDRIMIDDESIVVREGDDGLPMLPEMRVEIARVLGEKLDDILLTPDNHADPSKCKRLIEAVDVVVVELKRHNVAIKMSSEAAADFDNVSRETNVEGGE